jgi:hypothetical protein
MPVVQRKAVSGARSQVPAAIHSVVRSSIARFRRCRARSDSAMAHESSFGRPPRVHDRRLFAGKRGVCRPLVGEDCRWSRAARISNPGRSSSSTTRSSCRPLAQSLRPLRESRCGCLSPGPLCDILDEQQAPRSPLSGLLQSLTEASVNASFSQTPGARPFRQPDGTPPRRSLGATSRRPGGGR